MTSCAKGLSYENYLLRQKASTVYSTIPIQNFYRRVSDLVLVAPGGGSHLLTIPTVVDIAKHRATGQIMVSLNISGQLVVLDSCGQIEEHTWFVLWGAG